MRNVVYVCVVYVLRGGWQAMLEKSKQLPEVWLWFLKKLNSLNSGWILSPPGRALLGSVMEHSTESVVRSTNVVQRPPSVALRHNVFRVWDISLWCDFEGCGSVAFMVVGVLVIHVVVVLRSFVYITRVLGTKGSMVWSVWKDLRWCFDFGHAPLCESGSALDYNKILWAPQLEIISQDCFHLLYPPIHTPHKVKT